MKLLVITCCCVSLLAVSGCGSSPDSLMKRQIEYVNDLAEAIEKNEPQAKLDEIQARGNTLKEKFEALNLSADEKQKLGERHKDELTKAQQRLMKAMMSKVQKGFGEKFPGFPTPSDAPK